MTAITITEALAELKLIDNKIANKNSFILSHLYRNKALVDPLADEGGSPEAVAQALQAIGDLRSRKLAIRAAINHANQTNEVTCGGATRTIEEWLVWRRLVYPESQASAQAIVNTLRQARHNAGSVGNRLQAAQTQSADDIIVHIKEKEYVEAMHAVQEVYDRLDGLLSLKNAQIMVDV